jgi:hypothetical protein
MSRAIRPHPIWPSAMVLLGAFSPNTLDGIMVGNATAAPAAFRNVRLELFIACTPWLTYMFDYSPTDVRDATKKNYIIFSRNYIIYSWRLTERPIILSFQSVSRSICQSVVHFPKNRLELFWE